MKLYFYEDMISPFTGEVLYTQGEEATEEVIKNLLDEDIWIFCVTPVKPKNEASPYPSESFIIVEDDPDILELDLSYSSPKQSTDGWETLL